jgi:hypothetical protein
VDITEKSGEDKEKRMWYKWNMQEPWYSILRPNLQIMGIEVEEEQAKGTGSMLKI